MVKFSKFFKEWLMLSKKYVVVLGLSLGLTACQNVSHQDVGTVTGGVVGGLIGSQFGGGAGKVAATIGGAVVGGLIGGSIGHTMDKVDQMQMQRALETAPTGRVIRWQNPDSGNRYTVEPTRTYYEHKQPCREYITRAMIGGKNQQIYGRACRQADGSWRVVS
jgi:surface antigen